MITKRFDENSNKFTHGLNSNEEANIVKKIIQSNKVNYWSGKTCREFEQKFSDFHNLKYAVSVMNGSVALEIALRAINLKDDEVIVTSKSFIISASSVIVLEQNQFFQTLYESGNIDPESVKKLINKKLKRLLFIYLPM